MAVDDLKISRKFYTDALGLSETNAADTRVCLKIGPTTLELHQDEANTAAIDQPAIDHFALNARDIDETYTALKDRVSFQAPPHTTEVGHRNMQRALLAFADPNGFTIQISETVDTRDHLASRRRAKEEMAVYGGGLLRGFDHLSTYCTNFASVRAFYSEQLALEEFFYSSAREEGETVASGFEQAAFAVGGTDIELASDENWNDVQPGRIRSLGFSTDDIDGFCQHTRSVDAQVEGQPKEATLALRHPDGLTVDIYQVS